MTTSCPFYTERSLFVHRGWTPEEIAALGEPDYVRPAIYARREKTPGKYYRKRAPVRLYSAERVIEAERKRLRGR